MTKTINNGTKYSYELISSYNSSNNTPVVVLNTDSRANTKAFKAEVEEICKLVKSETGIEFVMYNWYTNLNASVWSRNVIR